MRIGNLINNSFDLLSKQLRFYCWHFRRDLDAIQGQELIQLLYEQHFEMLANKIRSLNQNAITDSRQQIGKLLFDHCLTRNRRHQLIQLIESGLVDIDVRLDNYGRTLLHRAAYNLDVELVKILIEHNVNIRLLDYAGNTALHIAIQSYRNGAFIYGNGPDMVDNLTSIIKALLVADKNLRNERIQGKRIRVDLNRDRNNNDTICDDNQPSEGTKFIKLNSASSGTTSRDLDTSTTCLSPKRKIEGRNHDSSLNGAPEELNRKDKSGGNDADEKVGASKPRGLSICSSTLEQRVKDEFSSPSRHCQSPREDPSAAQDLMLIEDPACPLVDAKNAFGRTALHYCVLLVGEQHLAHFVKLLISFGADTDAVDTRMKTPLYCLVKRPYVSAIKQKCQAISYLLKDGCDDLGLAIEEPEKYFSSSLIRDLEKNLMDLLQSQMESTIEPIFTHETFKRAPSLKHLARLKLIKLHDKKAGLKRQTKLSLPVTSPATLDIYVNRKILDQSELF